LTIKKTALIILDGWGIGNQSKSDAIYHAHPSYFNSLLNHYPHNTLTTFGNAVGLPKGQMGNSEVGHINLGAGRVVWQMLEKINRSFKNGDVIKNEVFQSTIEHAKDKNIHLMGLLSDGGVHSSIEHILEMIRLIRSKSQTPIYVHAFLDGRDTDPQGGQHYLNQLEQVCQENGAKVSSIVGRYYAMDRDKRWERTQKAYDLLVNGNGELETDAIAAVKQFYAKGITDEFMEAIKIIDSNGEPLPNIQNGDTVFNLNFRTDRPRQITDMLVERNFEKEKTKALHINYISLTRYDARFKNIQVLFEEENVQNTLGECLAKQGIKQLRAAETEKYPHVTFFFNGGREAPFDGESREMAPSPKVATYDLKPEMSAFELTESVLPYFSNDTSFICLNYANADMVGHTGDYEAIKKAVHAVDQCLEKIVNQGLKNNWQFIVIADHGNADFAINDDGTANTQHSLNPVPCIFIGDKTKTVENGKLADLAPTILSLMGVDKPTGMDGNVIIK